MGIYIGGKLIRNITTGTVIVKDISEEEYQIAVDNALRQVKESGEFDGATPQKGVDYWTEEERDAMINEVIAAIPHYAGEVES